MKLKIVFDFISTLAPAPAVAASGPLEPPASAMSHVLPSASAPCPPPGLAPPSLEAAEPRSLRLLVGHLVARDRPALERAGLLPEGPPRPQACAAVFQTLARLLRFADARRVFDEVAGARLGTAAAGFTDASLHVLAERFAREAHRWPRTTLVALLWSLARRPEERFRRLERRVADRLERCGHAEPDALR